MRIVPIMLIALLLVGCGTSGGNRPVVAGPGFMQDQADDLARALDTGTVNPVGDRLRVVLPAASLFADDQANVQRGALEELVGVAQVLSRYATTQINIEGHANPAGRDEAEHDLSLRRAQAVAGVLAANGVEMKRLVMTGVGGQRPVADPETALGAEQNPRIELMIIPVPAWMPPAPAKVDTGAVSPEPPTD